MGRERGRDERREENPGHWEPISREVRAKRGKRTRREEVRRGEP